MQGLAKDQHGLIANDPCSYGNMNNMGATTSICVSLSFMLPSGSVECNLRSTGGMLPVTTNIIAWQRSRQVLQWLVIVMPLQGPTVKEQCFPHLRRLLGCSSMITVPIAKAWQPSWQLHRNANHDVSLIWRKTKTKQASDQLVMQSVCVGSRHVYLPNHKKLGVLCERKGQQSHAGNCMSCR